MRIGDYIVPKQTSDILQIEDIEIIAGVRIYYTKCRKSFARNQFESLDTVYKREFKKISN